MKHFTSHGLYRFTGSREHAPEGFDKSPKLEVYLNHLEAAGLSVFAVIATTDQMWYSILTVKEI